MVSVLLPARDAAATLPAALQSLLGQTLADFEILALDDGSDDDGATWRVMEDFARRDARIVPLRLPGLGIAGALNRGLELARGDLVARMDADDICLPERLGLQARHLADNPGHVLVSCRAAFGGDARSAAGYKRYLDFANALLDHEDMALNRFRESPLPHPTVMFRRKAVMDLGGYADGPFPEDYELWLRLFDAGARLAKLPETLLIWNDPPGRLSRVDARYSPEAFARVKARYLARHLARVNPHHPDILVAGAGRITRARAVPLTAHGARIKAWLDIDPKKVGREAGGIPVLDRRDTPPPESCFVVSYVASHGAAEDVAAFLAGRGFVPGVNFLPAAL